MNTFFEQMFCECNTRYSLIIEDDGRVCYAYLMDGDNITGDVWLYNTVETPKSVNWSSKEDMPFLNPEPYVDFNKVIKPIARPIDINVDWITDGIELQDVNIFIRQKLIAKLKIGSKPGWSAGALKDGPLAKILT